MSGFSLVSLLVSCTAVVIEVSGLNFTRLYLDYVELRTASDCQVDLCSTHFVPKTTDSCCARCSCEADCVQYNTCCPDYFLVNSVGNQTTAGYKCIYTHVGTNSINNDAYWLVSKCHEAFQNVSVVRQCESPVDNDIQALVPVLALSTGTPYRNKFCAECNFRSSDEYVFWGLNVTCGKGIFLPHSFATIISDIYRSTDCFLSFVPDAAEGIKTCSYEEVHKNTVNNCNVSGLWDEYDSFIEEACNSYRALYTHETVKYNNIFCHVCNKQTDKLITSYCFSPKIHPNENKVSFSALLDFRPKARSEVMPAEVTAGTTCSMGSTYDVYKDTCRELLCPSLTMLDEDSQTCQPAFTTMSRVCHEANITLSLPLDVLGHDTLPTFTEVYQAIYEEDKFGLYKTQSGGWNGIVITEIFSRKSTSIVPYLHREAKSFMITLFLISIKFAADKTKTQTILGLDKTLLRLTFRNSTIEVFTQLDTSIDVDLWTRSIAFADFVVIDACDSTGVFVIGPLFQCQAVALSRTEYNWTHSQFGLTIQELNWTLRRVDFEYMDYNDSIKVCLSNYKLVTAALTKPVEVIDGLVPSQAPAVGTLSMVCVCSSMVCLVTTLLTYSVFPELRTIPGKNNMVLAFCLLIAQALFQFGGGQTGTKLFCKVNGALVHFFLLLSLFWMHVCSFHMFRVFRSVRLPRGATVRSGNRVTLVYALYTTSMAVALVLVNVLVTFHLSGGNDFGYGLTICYISYHYMVAFTATLPAMLVVTSNVVMFAFVVCTIYRLPDVPSETVQNRNYFLIYIKLSTLTGITYLLAVPLFLAYHPVVEYVYIILNGSQGVFIMVAFVCNKQVKDLFLSRSVCRKHKQSSSTSNTHRSNRLTVLTSAVCETKTE